MPRGRCDELRSVDGTRDGGGAVGEAAARAHEIVTQAIAPAQEVRRAQAILWTADGLSGVEIARDRRCGMTDGPEHAAGGSERMAGQTPGAKKPWPHPCRAMARGGTAAWAGMSPRDRPRPAPSASCARPPGVRPCGQVERDRPGRKDPSLAHWGSSLGAAAGGGVGGTARGARLRRGRLPLDPSAGERGQPRARDRGSAEGARLRRPFRAQPRPQAHAPRARRLRRGREGRGRGAGLLCRPRRRDRRRKPPPAGRRRRLIAGTPEGDQPAAGRGAHRRPGGGQGRVGRARRLPQ